MARKPTFKQSDDMLKWERYGGPLPAHIADELIVPVVNINGTSRQRLLEGYTYALEALRRAESDIMAIAPHGRDFPFPNEGLYVTAAKQHSLHLFAVKRLIDEISHIAVETRKQKSTTEDTPS